MKTSVSAYPERWLGAPDAKVSLWATSPPEGKVVVRQAKAFLPSVPGEHHIGVVVEGFSEERLATVTRLLDSGLIRGVTFHEMANIGNRRLAIFRAAPSEELGSR